MAVLERPLYLFHWAPGFVLAVVLVSVVCLGRKLPAIPPLLVTSIAMVASGMEDALPPIATLVDALPPIVCSGGC